MNAAKIHWTRIHGVTARLFITNGLLALFLLCGLELSSDYADASGQCDEVVSAFLSSPSETTLEGMSRGHPDECWNAVGSSNARLQTVNNLVASGNREAALYLASNLKRLDGGNLEDALVALGQFAEITMAPLLEFARNQVLTNSELSDALTMLPLSSSDDPEVQLAEMEKRRAAVGRVTDRRLTEQKALAFAAIDSFIIEIKRSINH